MTRLRRRGRCISPWPPGILGWVGAELPLAKKRHHRIVLQATEQYLGRRRFIARLWRFVVLQHRVQDCRGEPFRLIADRQTLGRSGYGFLGCFILA